MMSILGGLPCLLLVTNGAAHTIEIANQAFFNLVGDRPLIGRPSLDALPETLRVGILSVLDHVYATGEPFISRGMPINFSPQSAGRAGHRYIDVSCKPRTASDGAVTGVIFTGFDVTKQKMSELRLRRVREALRRKVEENKYIFENSHEIICSADRTGCILDANQRMTDILLYTHEELIGRNVITLSHPDDADKMRAARNAMLFSGGAHSFESRFLRKDGVEVPLLWSTIWSPKQRATYATAQDLTERYKVEGEIRRAQKMEALGQLTGGIAHDFNNLLTVIVGNAELLASENLDPRQTPILAAEICQVAERGADLTQHLLTFAQRQPLKPNYFKVEDILSELMPLVRRAVEANIEIRTDIETSGSFVLVDRTLLESALLNLVVNARDAMPGGGQVTIKTEVRGAEAGEDPLAVGQDVVTITVADDGPGMSPDVLSRAFEPFFTTKGHGQGSGLGLSMVYSFAQQAGGLARVETALGEGTAITLILPAVAGHSAEAIDLASTASRLSVLVVKTDRQRLQLVSARLLSLGHDVTEVRTAEDAFAVLASRTEIKLMITDGALSGEATGLQFVTGAIEKFPWLSAILVVTEEELVGKATLAQGSVALLSYPYSRKQLAACIHRVTSHPVRSGDG